MYTKGVYGGQQATREGRTILACQPEAKDVRRALSARPGYTLQSRVGSLVR